jgi:hypothetical protein
MTSTHVMRTRTPREMMARALYVTLAVLAFGLVLIVISGIHPWGV